MRGEKSDAGVSGGGGEGSAKGRRGGRDWREVVQFEAGLFYKWVGDFERVEEECTWCGVGKDLCDSLK